MKVKDISVEDQPRNRLINKGAEALSSNELMAILIRSGTKKESAMELSNRIINTYSLGRLAKINYSELITLAGIKESKACSIIAAFELVKRCYSAEKKSFSFDNAKAIYDYMSPLLNLEIIEILYALYVDVKCNLLDKSIISKGRAYYVYFDVKAILTRAVELDCYGVILVHNHPSGDTNPSKSDVIATKEIQSALKLIDIALIDHVIIGKNDYFSFIKKEIL